MCQANVKVTTGSTQLTWSWWISPFFLYFINQFVNLFHFFRDFFFGVFKDNFISWGFVSNKNKEKILSQQKEYKEKNGQVIKERNKVSREQNIEAERTKDRIKYWRNRQKALALKMLEFNIITRENTQFQGVLPTLALS